MRSTAWRLAASSLLLLGCQAPPPAPEPAKAARPPSSVFEPAKGTRCDRSTKVCEYRGGPTVGLTRLFFGDGAADALEPRMSASSYPFDPIFKPAPGASCDTLVTTCYDENGASEALTRQHFGSDALKRLERRLRQRSGSTAMIERRGDYITCDHLSQVCYDRMGAGYGVTRMYLGEEQADRLMARLQAWKREKAASASGAPTEAAPSEP